MVRRPMWLEQLERDGFAVVAGVICEARVAALVDAVESFSAHAAVRERAGVAYAVRRLCTVVPAVAELAGAAEVRGLVEPVLGVSARVVRSLLFDKRAGANWKVPWHQDVTIAVAERRDVAGYGPWSVKAGVPHMQPPAAVLEGMVTVRLHLDDCGMENGPLRVVPGSHRSGVLDAARIAAARAQDAEVACTVGRGGAVLMRPLLLHASSPATIVGHRRVIHLEFAGADLPGGLEWGDA